MTGVAARLRQYLRGSYPPLPSSLFAAAWAYGVSGLFAAVDPRESHWRPGVSTALAALTLFVDLLLMRAVDDIRDLDYDRRLNPDRPLARGAVRVADLVVLYAAGSVVLVGLNATAGWGLVALAAQLGYAAAMVASYRRWHWPAGDNLPVNLVVSLPAPVLAHLYLYAGYLRDTHLGAHWRGAVAIIAVVLATGHVEVAKKLCRTPAPGERTYVASFGLAGTLVIALAAPVGSVIVLLATAHPPPGWALLAAVPLALPLAAAWRFWRTAAARWPAAAPPLFMLATFAGYLAIGLRL